MTANITEQALMLHIDGDDPRRFRISLRRLATAAAELIAADLRCRARGPSGHATSSASPSKGHLQ